MNDVYDGLRLRTFGHKKAATSTFSNPSLVSPTTPTLANPVRGFGLPTNNVIQTAIKSVNQQVAQSAGHNISSIALHRPQAKLTVGAPNDVYEQEADRVADQVMSMPDGKGSMQRETMPEEEEEEIQTKTLGNSIQCEALPEEEEIQTKTLAAKITPLVQRETMPEEEEEEIQTKTLGDSIQREVMPEEEEEEIQTKTLGDSIQREVMPEEEEEEIQTKSSPDTGFQAESNLENRLSSSQGGGSALPDEVRSFMEPRFGADFSRVRVHTGGEAVQMNRELNAQAFTHKQDIYYGAGKAPGKDALTAHELTHVVQQLDKAHLKLAIQRKPTMSADFNTAVKQAEWQIAGEVLNGFNKEDIIARLRRLNNTQILQIKDGAIKNPKVGPNAGVVKVIAEFSPLVGSTAIETVSFHLSDGPYGWDANYDIWMMGKTVFARLRINLVAGAGVTAKELKKLQKTWEQAQDKWSGQYKLVDSSDAKSRYSVKVIVQFVKTDVDQTVTVKPGPARSDMTDWDTKDDKHAASHEIGHMLGQKDEYADPMSPSRTVTDSSSVMNTNTGKVQKAHYQNFATWLSSKTGKTFVVK